MLDTALRRGLTGAIGFAGLVAVSGAYSIEGQPVLLGLLPWFGAIPFGLLTLGYRRRPAASLLLGLLVAAAILTRQHAAEPPWILGQLAIALALVLLWSRTGADRASLDHWRRLGRVELADLNRALRVPMPSEADVDGRRSWRAIGLARLTHLDALYSRSRRDDELTVLYDEDCHFCARTLQWLRFLDPAGVWTMRSRRDLPDGLRARADLDLDQAMFVLENGRVHRGYRGFVRMLAAYGMNAILVRIGQLPWAVAIGDRVYAEVAARRATWFVCSPDENGLPPKEKPEL